jgi:hypothetical protein
VNGQPTCVNGAQASSPFSVCNGSSQPFGP